MDVPDDLPTSQYAVYALVGPTDHLVYYVGQTRNPTERLAEHLKARNHQGRKAEWVRNLKQQGQRPRMQILEIVTDAATALAKEQAWIHHFLEQKMPLFNEQAQPRPAREASILLQEISREVIIPLRQTIAIIACCPIILVWLPDDRVAATLRSFCAMLGIAVHGQIERIRRNKDLAEHLMLSLVKTAGGPQRMAVLMVEAIPAWVMGLQLTLVAPEKHPLILTLKQGAYDIRFRSLFKSGAE